MISLGARLQAVSTRVGKGAAGDLLCLVDYLARVAHLHQSRQTKRAPCHVLHQTLDTGQIARWRKHGLIHTEPTVPPIAHVLDDFWLDKNDSGERIDFHCLRHTCGVWLARAGGQPKVVQSVMRHSSITMTMDTYGHLFPGQEADAVDRLEDVMHDGPDPLRATGTDQVTVNTPDSARRDRVRGACEAERGNDRPQAAEGQQEPPRNSLRIAGLDESVRSDAPSDASGRGGT